MKGCLEKSRPVEFAKFTGKHICWSLFFNKVAGMRPVTFLNKRLQHKCFLVNFAKILRTPFLWNTSGSCFFCLLRVQVNFIKNAYSGYSSFDKAVHNIKESKSNRINLKVTLLYYTQSSVFGATARDS